MGEKRGTVVRYGQWARARLLQKQDPHMLAARYPVDARRLAATGPIVRVEDGMRTAPGRGARWWKRLAAGNAPGHRRDGSPLGGGPPACLAARPGTSPIGRHHRKKTGVTAERGRPSVGMPPGGQKWRAGQWKLSERRRRQDRGHGNDFRLCANLRRVSDPTAGREGCGSSIGCGTTEVPSPGADVPPAAAVGGSGGRNGGASGWTARRRTSHR